MDKNYINELDKSVKESEENVRGANYLNTIFTKDSKIIIDQYIDKIEFSKDGVVINTELGDPIIIPAISLIELFNAK